MSENKKCCNHIKGINCDVKNCAYHDGESYCTAGEITVGPTYAATGHDTVCATFKPNENSHSTGNTTMGSQG